ncbi:zinc-dependent metalloprotease [Solimonas marina]|uniref:DUF5117 domain-containing protein n=1 Tax=Solimonas marina TaxID=2714601 RepID=A0A970B801_9GAMM|nr:zinc-dependent metalloprotease [Solimonas marina]NKF24458.1 DUF5117 domain-containing protein [Solimonas marina]
MQIKGRIAGAALALAFLSLLSALTPAQAATLTASQWAKVSTGYQQKPGLFPLYIDRADNRVLAQLPPPDASGVMMRVIHHSMMSQGTGAPSTHMERSKFGPSRLLRFRRVGQRVVAEYENTAFKASASPLEQLGAEQSFPTSAVWAGDVIATLADGSTIVDLSSFFTRDAWGMLDNLNHAGQGHFRQDAALSMVDATSARAYPDNLEVDATFTFRTDDPGKEIQDVTPDSNVVTVKLHHSLIRLPDDGYQPRVYDPRIGGFDNVVTDFSAPLDKPLVTRLAHRFRLQKTDPSAARSTVKKPIVFYVDNTAPPRIQQALIDGASWWKQAFDAMGYIDAFQVKVLPKGADPYDARYNMIFWSHRVTRGWSYGHLVLDPRTGEIVHGDVLLGSQRTRQDIIMFEGLLGTANSGKGGPNDPVELALARLRQLTAHEAGHVLGFEHNFASNTQGRSSVLDYPAPLIKIVGDHLDFSDAYGVGIGEWDKISAYALYSEDPPAVRSRKVDEALRHYIYRGQPEGRSDEILAPLAAPWVNGTDPVEEMKHVMRIRRIALDHFGLNNLPKGSAVFELRRRIVPIYLYHRYQAEATAKLIAGADYGYPLNGHGDEDLLAPVPRATQKAAVEVLLDALAPSELTFSPEQLKLLAAQTSGVPDPQNDIEIFTSRMSRSFDSGMAAEVAADIVLDAMFKPERINGLVEAMARDPQPLGLGTMIDMVIQRVFSAQPKNAAEAEVARRVQLRTVIMLARRLYGVSAPAVPGAVPLKPSAPLSSTAAAIVSEKLAALGVRLSHAKAKDPVQQAHDLWLASLLEHPAEMKDALRSGRYDIRIPPGSPI